jgi:hypothetical protein
VCVLRCAGAESGVRAVLVVVRAARVRGEGCRIERRGGCAARAAFMRRVRRVRRGVRRE